MMNHTTGSRSPGKKVTSFIRTTSAPGNPLPGAHPQTHPRAMALRLSMDELSRESETMCDDRELCQWKDFFYDTTTGKETDLDVCITWKLDAHVDKERLLCWNEWLNCHPNIAFFHAYVQDGFSGLGIITDADEELDGALRDGCISVHTLLGYFLDIASAMRFAHAKGVVHGNLVLTNICVSHKNHRNAKVTGWAEGEHDSHFYVDVLAFGFLVQSVFERKDWCRFHFPKKEDDVKCNKEIHWRMHHLIHECCAATRRCHITFHEIYLQLRQLMNLTHSVFGFVCPLTHHLLEDPVVAADGISYERSAMFNWLDQGLRTSPVTHDPLSSDHVVSNHNLKEVISQTIAAKHMTP